MAAQSFQYTKISELTSTTTATDDSLLVINVGGDTKKITYGILKNLITSAISSSLTALTTRVTTLETSVTNLTTRVGTAENSITDMSGTIDNIIAAGFNLIGIDDSSEND